MERRHFARRVVIRSRRRELEKDLRPIGSEAISVWDQSAFDSESLKVADTITFCSVLPLDQSALEREGLKIACRGAPVRNTHRVKMRSRSRELEKAATGNARNPLSNESLEISQAIDSGCGRYCVGMRSRKRGLENMFQPMFASLSHDWITTLSEARA